MWKLWLRRQFRISFFWSGQNRARFLRNSFRDYGEKKLMTPCEEKKTPYTNLELSKRSTQKFIELTLKTQHKRGSFSAISNKLSWKQMKINVPENLEGILVLKPMTSRVAKTRTKLNPFVGYVVPYISFASQERLLGKIETKQIRNFKRLDFWNSRVWKPADLKKEECWSPCGKS